jgi:kynurenine formamidase
MESHDLPGRLGGVREFIALVPHGSHTHLDALSHIMWDDRMYNGFPASAVTSTGGATKLSVHQIPAGVTGRGVLLDVTAVRGVPWLEVGEGVFPEDLEAAEERQGVQVREGDVLLVYTGNFERVAEHGVPEGHGGAGLTAACLPWLHEREVALLSGDNINDVQPSGFSSDDSAEVEVGGTHLTVHELLIPVHAVALTAMGLWLVDNMVLAELRDVCAQYGRWEFLFTMSTLRIVGATSSPVNPVAIF